MNNKSEKKYLLTETDKVGEIAIQYGFTGIIPPIINSDIHKKAKNFQGFDFYGDCEEKIAMLNWYNEKNLYTEQQPVMVFYKKPLQGSGQRKKPREDLYGLEIMGSNRNTSEALIIKTAMAILNDIGHKDIYIDINSIGDKESFSKFEKELHIYCRKNSQTLTSKIKSEAKKNIYSIARETSELPEGLPQSIGSLSEVSRTYFKETLEYLEAFNVSYKINSKIISNKTFSSHTVFEIRESSNKKEDGELLAYGYRYNLLAKKIGLKKDISCIGCTLISKDKKNKKKVIIQNIKKPRFYLVQLGNTAKLKALNVVEFLRKNKIPVYHSLTKDKITGQLTGAEYMHASHVLIIGQKEALEDTVVVRNIENREQETVPLNNLPELLKKLEKIQK